MKSLFYVSVGIAALLGSATLAVTQNGRGWVPSGLYANEYNNRIIEHPVGRRGHSANPAHDVYRSRGQYLGSDPDPAVRREIARDFNPGS